MRKFPKPSSYWSQEEGRQVVEAWQRSGENATTFARRHGLHAKRLVYWSKRFAMKASVSTLTFAPAAIVAADEVAATIRTPSGIAIELASATPSQIAAVASALARSSP